MNKKLLTMLSIAVLGVASVGSAAPTVSVSNTHASKGRISASATELSIKVDPVSTLPRLRLEGRIHRDQVKVHLPAPFPTIKRFDRYGTASVGYEFHPTTHGVKLTPSIYGLATHESSNATLGGRINLEVPVSGRTTVQAHMDVRNKDGRKESGLAITHKLTKHVSVRGGVTAYKQNGVKAAGGMIGIEIK